MATLRKDGYRVETANDGEEIEAALKWLGTPALILLDLAMPNVGGFAACRHLRSVEATRGIPIVYLTGHDDWISRLRARLTGAEDFLSKPFDVRKLLDTVHRFAPLPAHLTADPPSSASKPASARRSARVHHA